MTQTVLIYDENYIIYQYLKKNADLNDYTGYNQHKAEFISPFLFINLKRSKSHAIFYFS